MVLEQSIQMTSLIERSASRPTAGSGFDELFRYHGWLAPGVRLFRRIGFQAKALWIGAAMLIPLLLMQSFLTRSGYQQIEAARSERQGLSYARPLLDLVHEAQTRRQAVMASSANAIKT
jgi:hypothetical protein